MKNRVPAQNDVVALAVLALLSEKATHPYEMHRLIRQRGKDFVTGLPRSLYRAVDRLQEAELIEAIDTQREGGRPERTIYRVTEEGRKEFHAWLTGLLAGAPDEPSLFNVAISLLPYLSPDEAVQALKIRVASLEGQVSPAEATLRHVGSFLPRLYLLEVEHARVLKQAELDWVLKVIEDIESGALSWVATPQLRLVSGDDR